MKIIVENYNSDWNKEFEQLKSQLLHLLGFLNPAIEHILSTSVNGLSAKPVIDILVGLNSEADLDRTIEPMLRENFVYYACYNEVMPYRRFFVKHRVNPKKLSVPQIISERDRIPATSEEIQQRLAHIHILRVNSEHWLRHIAFREYLRAFPEIRTQYQQLKENLGEQDWKDGNDYNSAKNDFIKAEETNALNWYKNR